MDRYNKNMANSSTRFGGTLVIGNEIRGFNSTSFRFSLQSILQELALERQSSKIGYAHYLHSFNGKTYDFRNHEQYRAFCKTIRVTYRAEETKRMERRGEHSLGVQG